MKASQINIENFKLTKSNEIEMLDHKNIVTKEIKTYAMKVELYRVWYNGVIVSEHKTSGHDQNKVVAVHIHELTDGKFEAQYAFLKSEKGVKSQWWYSFFKSGQVKAVILN